MLQVLRKGLKEIVVEEVPEPLVGTGEVKIRTAYSLISAGTEIAGLHKEGLAKEIIRERERILRLLGHALREQGITKTAQAIFDKFKELSITGYSGAGMVIERSPEIEDLHVGEMVAYGGIQTGHAEIVCAHRNLVAPVPEGINLKEASATTVGSIALHAVRNASIGIGDIVAIIGLGLVGQIVIQLARIAGARVIGIDVRQDRLEQAIDRGAEIALHSHENPQGVIGRLTGGQGVDVVIICASSRTSEPIGLAVDICRSRGKIVIVGIVKMEFPWEKVYMKELRVMGSRAYGPGSYDPAYEKRGIDYPIDYVRWTENRNMVEFLRLLQEKRIQIDRIITHEFTLKEAPMAFQALSSSERGMVGAILKYPGFDFKSEFNQKAMPLALSADNRSLRKDMLRVGVIGLGNIARWVHLPHVRKHPKLSLRGVCTHKGYAAKHLGIRFGSNYCSTNYRQIIEDPDIDLVMICTRNNLHASMAMEALKAGKHVFLEKPMAMTQEDCITLIQIVRRSGKGFIVNFNRRYSPMYKEVKANFMNKGPKLISIRVNSPDMTNSYWMMDPIEGGGAVLGEGCHFFDLMAWLTDSEPVSIFARNLALPQNKTMSQNNLACTISFQDGSVGAFVYGTIGHPSFRSERVEISAGGTTAVIDDFTRLWMWDSSLFKRKKKRHLRADKGYYQLLDTFVDGVFEGQSFEKEAIAGARATMCALAALKSLETGRPEKIDIENLGA